MFKLLTTLLLLSAVPSAYFQTSVSPTPEPTTPEPTTPDEPTTPEPTTPEPTEYTTTQEDVTETTTMEPETTTTPGPVVECEQLTLDGCGGNAIMSDVTMNEMNYEV